MRTKFQLLRRELPLLHSTTTCLKRQLVTLSLLLLGGSTYAQSDYTLPKVVQPSPQSQALTRYGDYPMAGFDGLTDITIPLHTIKSTRLSVPITMSFHASGRMANETNGILGIRWTLNCGGLVTRTMKGLPDEWNDLDSFDVTPYVNDANPVPFDILYSACPEGKLDVTFNPNTNKVIPKYDSEFDIFDYVLPNGKQGHFILKNQNGTKVPMPIPYEPIVISYVTDQPSTGYIGHVTITDDDGTRYVFGGTDTTTGKAVETTSECDIPALPAYRTTIPTAWYLTKIISSDRSDSILFSYATQNLYSYNASETAIIGDELRDNNTYLLGGTGDAYEDDFLVPYYTHSHVEQLGVMVSAANPCNDAILTPTLTGIKFKGGAATLSYTTANLLSKITISRDAIPYKSIKFNMSIHAGEADVSYLDSLLFYGTDQTVVHQKYAFGYYEANNIEQVQDAAVHKDWWGYYSSSVNNLLPYQQISITEVPGGNTQPVYQDIGSTNVPRGGDEDDKKMGMLKTITYPTGGQTEFIYEGNKYDGGNEGPGLRIKEIISSPISGSVIHKIYKYGLSENGIGILNKYLSPGTSWNKDLLATEGITLYYWISGINPLDFQQAGFRTRSFLSDPYLSFGLSGSPIKYDAVTEYYIKDGIPQQKTQTRYQWGKFLDNVVDFTATDHDSPILYPRKFVDPKNVWQSPVMTSKILFRYSNGQFDTAKSESFEYGTYQEDEAWDMPTYLHTNIVNSLDANSSINPYSEATDFHNNNCSVYGYGFRHYTTGRQPILHIETKEYTTSGIVKSDKYFDYDSSYQLRSETANNSRNETSATNYTYPEDYPANPVYKQMAQKNILSPAVSATENVNGVQVKKVMTNYYNPFTNIFAPQSIEVKNGSAPQEVIANFNRYDTYGNILEQQKSNDAKQTYLWGYSHQYPVAEVTGSDYNTVKGFVDTTKLNNAADFPDQEIRTELNKIRTGLAGKVAQVTTYTYAPLIGMTSSTDPEGNTTYYDYDDFGRLTLVRDNNNNVIKRYCYDYTGQPTENCAVVNYGFLYKNVAVSTTLNRNNCSAGYDGSSVTYTVPAGKYTSSVSQADADQKAQNDISANAQNYANTTGTCTSSRMIDIFIDEETNDPENQSVYELTFTPATGSPITFYPGDDDTWFQVPPGNYQVKISVEGYPYDSYSEDGYGSVYCRGDGSAATAQCESYGDYDEFNDYYFNADLSSSNCTYWTIQLNQSGCH